jgi:16S rRNA C967 or C1407 C5-methylase (RsmB/RsmF family)/NOL1/NOP2/fmu family ribosome biogenesis protein
VKLPNKLLESLKEIPGFNKEAFEKVHESREQVTSIRINPGKFSIGSEQLAISNPIHHSPFTIHAAVPWSKYGYYLLQRPSFTFDPLFHAGCYYVQEASSMFIEQALKQTVDLSQPLRVLDLAAAPGGKSTHMQSLISKNSLLVSNEVIRSRSNILKDNIIKWGSDNVIVTNNDPKDFAILENYFDVIVVDAPCSGSGLFRRDEEAIGEWSENNVQLCSQRQQRILADVWPALKKNGILIYSTCSYSKEEDEDIIEWMKNELAAENLQLAIDPKWKIVQSENGYRFWPDKIKGEGFFIACVKKLSGEGEVEVKAKDKIEKVSKKEMDIIKKWMRETDHEFVKFRNQVYAVPKQLVKEVNFLQRHLHVIYFGTLIGELIRDKLIPFHALAMSNLVSDAIDKVELNKEQAIAYLQKKSLVNVNIESKGWKPVSYNSYNLGWINVLPSRINNYYPKELRILKDI